MFVITVYEPTAAVKQGSIKVKGEEIHVSSPDSVRN